MAATKNILKGRFATQEADIGPIAKSWARHITKGLRGRVNKRKLIKTRLLLNSIATSVMEGAETRITLKYIMHGAWVDMGVGNGRTLAQIRSNNVLAGAELRLAGKKARRQRKGKLTQWYSRYIFGQVKDLAREIAVRKANAGAMEIAAAMPEIIEMQF
jgi:hypothetical protein